MSTGQNGPPETKAAGRGTCRQVDDVFRVKCGASVRALMSERVRGNTLPAMCHAPTTTRNRLQCPPLSLHAGHGTTSCKWGGCFSSPARPTCDQNRLWEIPLSTLRSIGGRQRDEARLVVHRRWLKDGELFAKHPPHQRMPAIAGGSELDAERQARARLLVNRPNTLAAGLCRRSEQDGGGNGVRKPPMHTCWKGNERTQCSQH